MIVCNESLGERLFREAHHKHVEQVQEIDSESRKSRVRSEVRTAKKRAKSVSTFHALTRGFQKDKQQLRIVHQNHILLDRILRVQPNVSLSSSKRTTRGASLKDERNQRSNFEISRERNKLSIMRENLGLAERLLRFRNQGKSMRQTLKQQQRKYLQQRKLISRYHIKK